MAAIIKAKTIRNFADVIITLKQKFFSSLYLMPNDNTVGIQMIYTLIR